MQRVDPMELNLKVLKCKKWNISKDRVHIVDKNNGMTPCLVIMFTLLFMVIKMLKKSLIFVFSADDSKNLVTFWVKLT